MGILRRLLFLLLFTLVAGPGSLRAADSLEATELAELRRYVTELKAGQPARAVVVERLAGVSYAGFVEAVRAYAELPAPIEPHTHRAFHMLLERLSREALSPWPMVTLYAPEFARFLTAPVADQPLSQKLFEQLRQSDTGRQAFDLAVRLTPEATLRYLAADRKPQRLDLLEAWNRRLARSRESRPIPELEALVNTIVGQFAPDRPVAETESLLRFTASWPRARKAYEANLRKALVGYLDLALAALAVQQRFPAALDLNKVVMVRFETPKLWEPALRNYAFDETTDHAETLRRLWKLVPAKDTRSRYQCLFAMSVHPRGNTELALQAVQQDPYELLDPALAVLRHDPGRAQQAIRWILHESKQGHEEALRLARELKLGQFVDEAQKMALDAGRDLVARQTALLYLQLAPGSARRGVLPLLAHPKTDLRLAAIRTFAEPAGLDAEDRNEIGPALIRVALHDPSMGHRQEAIHALGCWRVNLALEFFRKILADHPPVLLQEGNFNDERYWQYRFRLMGLLGLVKLKDAAARKELLELHQKGGPTERMDVLLAFLDLGEVPDIAFGDLTAAEPKLVATAATLIATHGDTAAQERMRKYFREAPLWREFIESGIDDHNILKIVGLKK